MKLLATLLLCVFTCLAATAQQSDPAVPARTAVVELTEKYQLTETQQVRMQEIQTRYYTDLARLVKLENADAAYYIKKRQALQSGTQGSIRLLLDKEQLKTFDQERRLLRSRRAELVQALTKAGKSELEIQRALLDVE